jgi:hypothetical protein
LPETVTLSFEGGQWVAGSQIEDYRLRGNDLEEYSFFDFSLHTYEIKRDPGEGDAASTESPQKRGRPPNQRSHYLTPHPKALTAQRIVRSLGHKKLISFVGRYFPKREGSETPNLYSASILALFKPWRSLTELMGDRNTWAEALEDFETTMDADTRRRCSNIQYYYHCSEHAQEKMMAEGGDMSAEERERFDEDQFNSLGEDTTLRIVKPVTLEDLNEAKAAEVPLKSLLHGQAAVTIGRMVKLFNEPNAHEPQGVGSQTVTLAEGEDLARLHQWQAELAEAVQRENECEEVNESPPVEERPHSPMANRDGNDARVETMAEAIARDERNSSINPVNGIRDEEIRATEPLEANLLPDQKRAFQIVSWHVAKVLEKRKIPQLLMLICGEGGTGKSRLIQAITEMFERRQSAKMVVKGAYTGIAASVINGKTLHVLFKLAAHGNKAPSEAVLRKVATTLQPVSYIIIDEMSMVSRKIFARISSTLVKVAHILKREKADEPFGGFNMIVVGDHHQFPPIMGGQRGSLYYQAIASESEDEVLGSTLYLAFETVVNLTQQVRITDPTWNEVLQHVRYGTCKEEHIRTIRSLVLTNRECVRPDFENTEWRKASLVTPRNEVRSQWNDAAVEKHCRATRKTRFLCPAEDSVRGQPLTLEDRLEMAQKNKRARGQQGKQEKSGLPDTVELAEGLEVLVTWNVQTDLDVTNGARGVITKIVLDPREPELSEAPKIVLTYPPAYVLVELQRTRAPALTGLPQGTIPIMPMEVQYKIKGLEGNKEKTVNRRQLPITAAYAFTDFRAQGQTLGHVVIDIAPVPSGPRLTQFNAYVALSRSSGRETIRLLRDFDEKLFISGLPEELRKEDERLAGKDKATREWWEAVQRGADMDRRIEMEIIS